MKFKPIFNWKFGKYPRKHDKQGSDGRVADFIQQGDVYKLFHWLYCHEHLDDFICAELELPEDYDDNDVERRHDEINKWILTARAILRAIVYSEDNAPEETRKSEHLNEMLESIWLDLVRLEDIM